MFKSLKKIRSEMNRTTFLINVPVDASIEEDRGGVWDWFVLAQVGGLPASSSLIHNRVSKVKDGTENRGSIGAIIRLVRKTVSLVTPPSCRCSRLRIRPQLLGPVTCLYCFLRTPRDGGIMAGICSIWAISLSTYSVEMHGKSTSRRWEPLDRR